MQSITKQYPLTVTINAPMHTPRLRGKQAAQGPYALGSLGDNLRMRISKVDRELVERIAHDLGMTKAEFARWATVEVARVMDEA